ncbi:putative protein transport protein Sec61 subunit beta-like [Capsicum annuum]|nr:putative protein transport protein Sec61 subunit beta-like [Capsicum annuum]KAF3671168.1 putative protein transport protein Sec61 subunit beta-like [Capsicum annuum]
MSKVLFGTPWLFDKYLLNVQAWEPGLRNDSAVFNICELWLQVWGIPLHWMSREVGRKIGHSLGGTTDVVIPKNGNREGKYMWVKAMMNIDKILPREKLIKLGHKTKWVEFRYEDMPYVTIAGY